MDVKRVLSLENKLGLADSDVNIQSKKGRVKRRRSYRKINFIIQTLDLLLKRLNQDG
jgi:hypothetical protein